MHQQWAYTQCTEVGLAEASQYIRHKDVERGSPPHKGSDTDTAGPLYIDSWKWSEGVMQLHSCLFSVWLIPILLLTYFLSPCSFFDSFSIFDIFVHTSCYVFEFPFIACMSLLHTSSSSLFPCSPFCCTKHMNHTCNNKSIVFYFYRDQI